MKILLDQGVNISKWLTPPPSPNVPHGAEIPRLVVSSYPRRRHVILTKYIWSKSSWWWGNRSSCNRYRYRYDLYLWENLNRPLASGGWRPLVHFWMFWEVKCEFSVSVFDTCVRICDNFLQHDARRDWICDQLWSIEQWNHQPGLRCICRSQQNWQVPAQKAKEKCWTNWSLIPRAEKSYLSINNQCFLGPPVLTRDFMWTGMIHSMIERAVFLSFLPVKTCKILAPIPCDKSGKPPTSQCSCCNLGVFLQIEWTARSFFSFPRVH